MDHCNFGVFYSICNLLSRVKHAPTRKEQEDMKSLANFASATEDIVCASKMVVRCMPIPLYRKHMPDLRRRLFSPESHSMDKNGHNILILLLGGAHLDHLVLYIDPQCCETPLTIHVVAV